MSFNVKNYFSSGIVNTDTDKHFIDNTQLTKAENVDFFQNGKNNIVSSIKGNTLRDGSLDSSFNYVGETSWDNKLYLFYVNTTNTVIQQYDVVNHTFTTVVNTTTNIGIPLTGVTDYDKFILSADVINGEFLYWCGGIRQTDGSLLGYSEPKRIHIEDAISDSGYDNFSCNLDKPDKLTVTGVWEASITNNLVKYDSYIFYKRYTNKYGETTVLSYPSNCIDVSKGSIEGLDKYNSISVAGFTVTDDIEIVDILMSNDSTNTFKVIKSIDTSVSKTISSFIFDNSQEYVVLDADSSDIINYEYPLLSSEQTTGENTIIYGNIETEYEMIDGVGNPVGKNIPFTYTTESNDVVDVTTLLSTYIPAGTSNYAFTYTFSVGKRYHFMIESWEYSSYTGDYFMAFYSFTYTYDGDPLATVISDLNSLISTETGGTMSIINSDGLDHHFTITNINGGNTSAQSHITVISSGAESYRGLNSNFK